MKRVFAIPLMVVLVIGLVFSGCAAPAPVPAPIAPAPGPEPTTPLPTPAPEKPTAAHEPYEITIQTIPAGTSAYAIGIVFANQINGESEWLSATCPEGINPMVHMKQAVEDPELRKHALMFNTEASVYSANMHVGATAEPPFSTFDYTEFRPCYLWGVAAGFMVTLNPELKTLKDLEGKRCVIDDVRGGSKAQWWPVIFKHAGVNIKPEYMDKRAAIEALKDGRIDACGTLSAEPQIDGGWVPCSGLPGLVAEAEVYYVNQDSASLEAAIEELNYPAFILTIPAGCMGEKQQPEPLPTFCYAMWFGVHESMPDEVVTEIMRVAYKYCETWKEYSPSRAIITRQTLGSIGVPESRYHPAALEFLKEKGVPIGALSR